MKDGPFVCCWPTQSSHSLSGDVINKKKQTLPSRPSGFLSHVTLDSSASTDFRSVHLMLRVKKFPELSSR